MGLLEDLDELRRVGAAVRKIQGQEQSAPEPAPVRQKANPMTMPKETLWEQAQRMDPITQSRSARQQIMAVSEPANAWYKGATPTGGEVMARIYTIGQTEPERGRQLWDAFNMFQDDPATPLYNPYRRATNRAVDELSALGFDMSGGVTQKWLEDNAWLKGEYRFGNGSNPLAPSKKSTPQQNAAYWYNKVLAAEGTTQRAEAEWAALQEEISYWANRKDRNYSDDEILRKIDWKQYKTLTGMDDDRKRGLPTTLNRGIGYSQDALTGVIWAARNGTTGDPMTDSAKAVLGQGTKWQRNDTIAAKLDPTSAAFSPYSVGSTLDEAALYFGVSDFSREWLDKNRGVLSSDDATAKTYYNKVYDAEQTTLKAEEELRQLKKRINSNMKMTSDPNAVLFGVLDDFPTLKKMDESRKSGDLLGLTRAVDYRWEDIVADVQQRTAAINSKPQGGQYVADVSKLLGGNVTAVESDTAIQATRDNAINAAGRTIQAMGTSEEKTVFQTAYSSDFNTYLSQINAAMNKGLPDPQKGYDYALKRANEYASENYLPAKQVIAEFETAKMEKEAALQELADMGATYEPKQGSKLPVAGVLASANGAPAGATEVSEETRKRNHLRAVIEDSDATIERLSSDYAEAQKTVKRVQDGYAVSDRLSALTGAKTGDRTSTTAIMDFAFALGAEYKPTEWRNDSLYAAAMKEYNQPYEKVAAAARKGAADMRQDIARIDYVLEQLDTRGVKIDPQYISNIQRERDRLERDIKDADYFLLRENKDYEETCTKALGSIRKAWQGFNKSGIGMLIGWDGFGKNTRGGYTPLDNQIASQLVGQKVASTGQDGFSSDDIWQLNRFECMNYLYLRETQGVDAAKEYYDHLTNQEYGIINRRRSEDYAAKAKDFASRLPVASSILSVIASPTQLGGTLYAAKAALTGEEINPYAAAFTPAQVIGTTRATVKTRISDDLKEQPVLDKVANLVYDAATSAGDSVLNAALVGGIGIGGAGLGATFAGAAPMGVQAAGSAMMDAKLRGANDTQAALMGTATFFAETATEMIPLDQINKAFKAGKSSAAKSLFQDALKDMFSEFVGESTNELVESIADTTIMGELSNRKAAVQKYRDDGMSLEEAERAANRDIFYNCLYAGITGMVSSGMHNAAGYAVGAVAGKHTKTEEGKAKVSTNETVKVADKSLKTTEKVVKTDDTNTDNSTVQDVKSEEQTPVKALEITQDAVVKPEQVTAQQVTALTASLNADEASQTATVGAALAPADPDPQTLNAASAAAQHLSVAYGAEEAAMLTREVLLTAAENDTKDTEGARVALMVGALNEDTATRQILNDMNENGVAPEKIAALIEAAAVDMENPEIASQLQQTVLNNQVALRVAATISNGALQGLHPYETALQQAKTNERNAQDRLDQAQKQQQVLGQNMQSIGAQVSSDPSNQATLGAFRQAIKDVEGHAKVVSEYAQSLTNAQTASKGAQQALDNMRDTLMRKVREQAQTEVAEAKMLETAEDMQYNNDEVKENAIQSGSINQGQGPDIGQLSPAPGRNDGRGDNLYAGSGTGEGAVGRGAESPTGYIRSNTGRVLPRLLKPASMEYLQEKGVTDLKLYEETDRQRFSDALEAGRQSNDHGLYVDPQSPEALDEKGAITILSEDNLAGAAIGTIGSDKGNIFGVFKHKKSPAKQASAMLMVHAIAQGGNKLDCYDGALSRMYASVGFIPVARVPFSDGVAPTGWNYTRDERPDVIFWMHNGDDADTVAQKYKLAENKGGYHIYSKEDITALPVIEDYDKAWAYRDDLLEKALNDQKPPKDDDIQRSLGSGANVTPGKPAGAPARSPQQIAKDLANSLNIGQAIGTKKMNRLPKYVLGYYAPRAKYLAVRNDQAGSFSTTMHELGHAIADKIGMEGTPEMVSKLDPVFAANYKREQLPAEAFAEFMWRYMSNEEEGRAFAGDAFVNTFERALIDNGLASDVRKSATDLRAWINAGVNDQIGATIHSRSEAKKTGLKEQWRHILFDVVDKSSPAELVNKEIRKQSGKEVLSLDEDIRKNLLLKNSATKRAFINLTESLTDANWERVGKGLGERFNEIGLTSEEAPLLERYMLALHSLDRDAQKKPVFDEHITPEARMAFIKQVQKENPRVVKAEKAFQEYRKEFLEEMLVKTGYLSEEAFNEMNAMYPHYVPTLRVKDERARNTNHNGGKTYQIRKASGSTEDIWSPIDSFVGMVDSIVTMVSGNNAALAWENAYHKYSLGMFGREITPDMKKTSVDVSELQLQIARLLKDHTEGDIFQQVINLIGTQQSQWKVQEGSTLPNVLTVQHANGTKSYYEIFDTDLYKTLASINDHAAYLPLVQIISKGTRSMSALTTGSNPVFATRNFLRDYQNSVNYGSWGTSYLTAFPKWLRAAYEVWKNGEKYQDYTALGGGGWTRIDTGTKRGAADYKASLYMGYNTENAGRTAKWIGKKLWNTITAERLNEVVEQASRMAEYMFGEHDLDTQEGRTEAYLAAQEATVDFGRSGNGNTAKLLKAITPFFNASLQGVYRTARMFSEAERPKLAARLTKTVVNTALASALQVALLLKFMDKDDKEEFEMLSDDLKSKHFYFPNFAPDVFGQQPLIRIPLAQDPLTYAIHGTVTNALWHGTTDESIISFGAIANTMLDNLNPVGSGTIFQPWIGVGKNKNWYGSRIVPSRMEGWEKTTQYTEETPDLFVNIGRAAGMSPLNVQYLAEQYTGFLGQMLVPALSKDPNTGIPGGIKAAINAARRRLTSDPLISNDIVGSFYDGATTVNQVVLAAKNARPMNMLRRGLSESDATTAFEDAKTMMSTKGIIGSTKKRINELYDQIDEINANQALNDQQKYILTSEKRKEIITAAITANEAIGEWKEKYVTGRNVAVDAIVNGTYATIPTAYDRMESTFKADIEQPYMQRAKALYDATGSDAALPHPNRSFTVDKKTYEISDADWPGYLLQYKLAYQSYMATEAGGWEALTEDEQLDVLKRAHSAGHNKGKKWYQQKYGIK